MGGAIIDFDDERARHGQLFAREDVLTKLRGWLVGDRALPRGWVLLLGSPGIGKSAIVSRILETLPGPMPPHHFLRRGLEGWDRPEVVVQNLCAQIEQMFPGHGDADLPTEARLGELLKGLSRSGVIGCHQRLILVIDGLDEAASDGWGQNPLPRFLPRELPTGVVILCASRPLYPHLSWLTGKPWTYLIDLDDSIWAASNEAACRLYLEHYGSDFQPPLDAAFIDAAAQRAEGNPLYTVKFVDWLRSQPPESRAARIIPHGLSGYFSTIWSKINDLDDRRRAIVMRGLGIVCAAREALPESLFGELLGWATTSECEDFLQATRSFLLEEPAQWHKGHPAYRFFHECFRELVSRRLGDRMLREHHRCLARTLAAWPPHEGDPIRRRYALRHAVSHRIEAGEVRGAMALCTEINYLESKCREIDVTAIEQDLEATIRALGSDASLDLSAILAAVSAEESRLRAHPESLPTLLYNRLRCAGWPPERIESVLRFAERLPVLRLLHGVRLGPTRIRSLIGHEKAIVACVVMPDGLHVLSASEDCSLRLWTLGSGECMAVLPGHEQELTSCAVTPDGRTAISTSVDTTAKLWDMPSQRCVGTLDNEGRWATACAVTPDGQRVVVGSDNGRLGVWDRTLLRRVFSLEGHTDYVTACLVSRDGQRLVSASRDGAVRVWDLESGECVHTLKVTDPVPALAAQASMEQGWVTALALMPEGRQVIAAFGDGLLLRWDLTSGSCVQRFGAGQGRVDTCAILNEGRHLLCGTADGTVVIWDLGAEQPLRRLKAHGGAVSACAVTPDGRRIVSASQDRSLKLWELGAPESLFSQNGHTAPISACAITPDGSTVVSASEDRTLKLWDVATGACLVTLEGHADLVTACAISGDGSRVLSGARDGEVRVWSRAPDGDPEVLIEHGDCVSSCAITASDAYAVLITKDGSARVSDLRSPESSWIPSELDGALLTCLLTQDGRRAVLVMEGGRIEVRDLSTGQRCASLSCGHEGRIFGCSLSPDGRYVVSVSEDKTLRVWSLATGKCLETLYGTSWFRCVAMTNTLICVGDEEGNLWMITVGARLQSRRRPRGSARSSARGSSSSPFENTRVEDRRTVAVVELTRKIRMQLAPLRDALARLYHSKTARMLAGDVGLEVQRLNLTGSDEDVWHEILVEAHKQCLLRTLVRKALRDYPGDSALNSAARDLKLL